MEFSSGDIVIEAIDSQDLAPPVQRALGCQTARVIDGRSEVLQGGAGFIGTVYRFADPERQAEAEEMFGRPFDNLVEHFAGVFSWLSSLGEEALRTISG